MNISTKIFCEVPLYLFMFYSLFSFPVSSVPCTCSITIIPGTIFLPVIFLSNYKNAQDTQSQQD